MRSAADTRAVLLPLIPALLSDAEPVRVAFAEQLPAISCVLARAPDTYGAIAEHVLPAVGRLLADPAGDVRGAGVGALVGIAGALRKEDLGPLLLSQLLPLTQQEDDALRALAAELVSALADAAGPDLCIQFFLSQLICLSEDGAYAVRRAVALHMHAICRCVGPTVAAKRLLPIFLALAADEVWAVRKAAAESADAVSKTLDPAARAAELVPAFAKLAEDGSKFVKNAARAHLGAFLATLPSAKVTPALLGLFLRAGGAEGGGGGAGGSSAAAAAAAALHPAHAAAPAVAGLDLDVLHQVAFTLPAVALTLGRARWAELRPLFAELWAHGAARVRRPLAHALHEIARIVGPEACEVDLCPALDAFLEDREEEVRIGAVRGFANFLGALPAPRRGAYMPLVDMLVGGKEVGGWRCRAAVAAQLGALGKLASDGDVTDHLRPLALKLLDDDIAAVRERAVEAVAPLLARVVAVEEAGGGQGGSGGGGGIAARLCDAAISPCFSARQRFVKLCLCVANFLRDVGPRGGADWDGGGTGGGAGGGGGGGGADGGGAGEAAALRRQFSVALLPPLLALAGDAVANVRLSLARAFVGFTENFLVVTERLRRRRLGKRGSSAPPPEACEGEGGPVHFAPPPPAPRAGGASSDLYRGIEEYALPLWARFSDEEVPGDAVGAGGGGSGGGGGAWPGLMGALVRLADDDDGEVLYALGPAWVSSFRVKPVADARERRRAAARAFGGATEPPPAPPPAPPAAEIDAVGLAFAAGEGEPAAQAEAAGAPPPPPPAEAANGSGEGDLPA
jgi:hypothetical protein